MSNRGVALLSVRAQMHRVFLHQILLQAGFAGIVQVLLAGGGMWLKGTNNGVLALVKRRLAGLLHTKIDQGLRCR